LDSIDAFEVFAGTGRSHTIDYLPYVRTLEMWEIDQHLTSVFHQSLPEATVRSVDALQELDRSTHNFASWLSTIGSDSTMDTVNTFDVFARYSDPIERSHFVTECRAQCKPDAFMPAHRKHLYRRADPDKIQVPDLVDTKIIVHKRFELRSWFI